MPPGSAHSVPTKEETDGLTISTLILIPNSVSKMKAKLRTARFIAEQLALNVMQGLPESQLQEPSPSAAEKFLIAYSGSKIAMKTTNSSATNAKAAQL